VPYEIFLAQILEEDGDRAGAYAKYAQIEPIAFGDSRVREGLCRTAPVEDPLAGLGKSPEARPAPAAGAPQAVNFEPAPSGSGLFDADVGSGLFAEPAAQGSGVFELDLSKGTEDWMADAAGPTAAPAGAQGDSMFELSGLGEVSSFTPTPEARSEAGAAGIFDISGGDTLPSDFLWKPPALEPITEEEEEEEVFEEPAAEESPSTELDESPIESLDEALQEADFYLKLGFREEAKKLLERLLHTYPRDERVRRRAEKVMSIPPELEEAEPAPLQLISPDELDIDLSLETSSELFKPEGPVAPVEIHRLSEEEEQPDEEAGFDLEVDSALDSLFTGGGSEAPIEEVLRYDVASSSGGDETANPKVHYDLGLAYKEMGLIEDAIQEFQAAVQLLVDPATNPQKILCYSMLANSFLQTGRYSDAMQCAEDGLRIPGQKEFEWKALKYDLCTAQAKQGDNEQAVSGFQEILARDPNYRDVKQRVEHLLQAHG
jgi:tetratricopeptide (TPR) repeat protein